MDIKTPRQILKTGLELMGWASRRVTRAKDATNQRRFRTHFGCHPKVLAQLYEDLQTTTIDAALFDSSKIDVVDFLATIHFLKRYPTEIEREALFNLSAKTIRSRTWMYLFKIKELKH